MLSYRILAGLIVFALGASWPMRGSDSHGSAADPGLELGKYLTQHGYGVMRVDSGVENSELVEPYVNGKRLVMLVDTGCDKTCLTYSIARHLKLNVRETKLRRMGAGGIVSSGIGQAVVTSFKLKQYEINRTNIIEVLPKDISLKEDGLLGYDYLHLNAVLLPVGADFFLFRPGPAALAAIDPFMNTMGYRSIPLHYGAGGLHIDCTLNGHPLTAIVDCGAALSIFDARFVTGVAGASLTSTHLNNKGVDGRKIDTSFFQPKSFVIGGVATSNLELGASYGISLPALKVQALLGYDVLALHSAIIDLGHNVLWMK